MEWLLFLLAYFVIGVVVGRVLFIKRLATNSRYYIGKQLNEYGREEGPLRAIDTDDLESARTYGLFSLFFWPLTTAIFFIQTPTPSEKRVRRVKELAEIQAQFERTAKEMGLTIVSGDVRLTENVRI